MSESSSQQSSPSPPTASPPRAGSSRKLTRGLALSVAAGAALYVLLATGLGEGRAVWQHLRAFSPTVLLLGLIIYLPYARIAAILKYLCIVMLVYFIVPFLSHQDLGAIVKATFIPTISFNKDFIAILVGILGTTISPYLFFWQASVEVEEMRKHKENTWACMAFPILWQIQLHLSMARKSLLPLAILLYGQACL